MTEIKKGSFAQRMVKEEVKELERKKKVRPLKEVRLEQVGSDPIFLEMMKIANDEELAEAIDFYRRKRGSFEETNILINWDYDLSKKYPYGKVVITSKIAEGSFQEGEWGLSHSPKFIHVVIAYRSEPEERVSFAKGFVDSGEGQKVNAQMGLGIHMIDEKDNSSLVYYSLNEFLDYLARELI